MMSYHTTGIILLKRDFREHDRIYTIYTSDYGKIEALGRGTRKITSKLASHLEPPSLVDLLIVKGKVFDHIAGAKRLEDFVVLRSDFSRLLEFARLAGIFDHEVKLEHKDQHLYRLLGDFLNTLNSNTPTLILPPDGYRGGGEEGVKYISGAFLTHLTQYTNHGIIHNHAG